MFTKVAHSERRLAQRYKRRSSCTLIQFENHWVGHVLNLSSKGVLIRTRQVLALESDQLTVHIELKNGQTVLMHGVVAHRRHNVIGLHCQPDNDVDARYLAQMMA